MNNQTIDVNSLSASEMKTLSAAISARDKIEKNKRTEEIKCLKGMQDDLCYLWLDKLVSFNAAQAAVVDSIFKDAAPLIALKSELYDIKDNQGSHTFTARDGSGSITVGHNMIIGFDGTSDIGVDKIQMYLSSLSKDDVNRDKIEKILNVLMKRNKKGELNPTRIVDLSNLKSDIDDDLFSEGVDIVVAAQFKTRTSSYVEGWSRVIDKNGKEIKIQFRITAK